MQPNITRTSIDRHISWLVILSKDSIYATAFNFLSGGSDGDSDGDDVAEVQPVTLDGPRGGAADDLKRIKGVGPGLEKTLNELGIYHFDQIAAWGAAHVEWVDARLKFKGRITRDEWIDQAKTLASGQDTAFSKRVDDGDVY